MTITYQWPPTKCSCGSALWPEWADEVAALVMLVCRSCGAEPARPYHPVEKLPPSYRPRRSA